MADNIEIAERQIQIKLHFKRSKSDWAKQVKYQNLYFVLDNYNYLKMVPPQAEFAQDDRCLAGITFFDADRREEDYALMDRATPHKNDDIIFSFESERVIRINCESVVLKTD